MRSRRLLWSIAALAAIVLFVTSNGVELIVEYLWMAAVGYAPVYVKILSAKTVLGLCGFAVALVLLWVNLAFAIRQVGDPMQYLPPELAMTPLGRLFNQRMAQRTVLVGSLAIAALSGFALSTGWEKPLLYFNSTSFGQLDPVFGRNVSFYLFTLPFLDQIQSFVWSIGFFVLLGVGAIYAVRIQAERAASADVISLRGFPPAGRLHLGLIGAFLLLVMAAGLYLDRFEEMYRAGGLFTGPGYSDIHGTLPVLALKAVTALVAAGVVVYALWRAQYRMLIGLAALFAVVWVGGNIYTSLLERFVVTPNQLEKERPYLTYHIAATNQAFGLGKVTERTLAEDQQLTAADIEANRPTVNNIRLWDHEPLLDTFAQIQEIRTYYDFVSVDNDRYRIDGELRQTMLSPRELSRAALPSREWVNERLTYTHGYGLTAGPVNRVNEQGLPVLFVKDLPPSSTVPEMRIDEPEIYYGELPDSYVFVDTKQKEFDYPEGDKNIFTTYNGTGGVMMNSAWRRLLISMYLRDFNALVTDRFTPQTRALLFRNVRQRVQTIAPFFVFDSDPYLVIHKGRLVWILDAYTLSDRYPYSEQVGDTGNYMRNPIKAVVDAKNGSVTFYSVDPTEPIAAAYARMFPGLVRPLSDMPPGLRAHLRYPATYFSIQASMYATYHMLDVNTFYNKEDQWAIPVVGNKRMEPYYTVMKLPGEGSEEFILMLPFTPRLKDNLAAWMVARSDGENYGRLVVYTFPKQKLVYGPKQMAARINQDPVVSQQITLWDQSGSNVIRGTLLVIPIESSLIYIQPLYLKAEDGRIPELKRVVVGYQNTIAMGVDLEDALERIFGSASKGQSLIGPAMPAAAMKGPQVQTGPLGGEESETPAQKAMRQYRSVNEAAKAGDWARFGRELQALGNTLEEMSQGKQQ